MQNKGASETVRRYWQINYSSSQGTIIKYGIKWLLHKGKGQAFFTSQDTASEQSECEYSHG